MQGIISKDGAKNSGVAGVGGSRVPLLGRLTQPLAEKTSVSPELGLYVLACSLAALLVISLVPSKR